MTYLLAAIASVSLLVGGIGIMNIMLVSGEPSATREIGLRIGGSASRRRHILLAGFLIEAITLYADRRHRRANRRPRRRRLGRSDQLFRRVCARSSRPGSILIAFGFAAAIGIFFGFYPARKASRLDPIEALRYE